MFDPRNPYERRMWHYESDRPLSIAQLIALGSLDVQTAALLWLLIERHTSYIISGPTDPMPGVGKTTTLNALLDFLPNGSSLVYTSGLFERFDFLEVTEPTTTWVLCNEVSDHLRIYMWGRVARRFLGLTTEGYAIATSMHADTLEDVLRALRDDLRLPAEVVSRLGIIVNIGLVGSVWPPRRRFLTVNLLQTTDPPVAQAGKEQVTPVTTPTRGNELPELRVLPLAQWDAHSDTFVGPDAQTLKSVANQLCLGEDAFTAALKRRIECLTELASGRGATLRVTRQAIAALQEAERDGQTGGSQPDKQQPGQKPS